MCKPSAPDTSRAEAEAARQRQLEQERADERLRVEREMWETQRADEERRYRGQLTAQQEEAQRQRELSLAEADRQYAAQERAIQQQQEAYAAAEAARAAERAEEERQARLKAQQAREYAEGRNTMVDEANTNIEAAYGGFNDTYFSKFAQDFVDHYKPQIERSYKNERDQSTYAFADAGTLRSSMAADSFGELDRGRAEKEASIAAQAQDRAQQFRGDIQSQKESAKGAIYSALGTASPVLGDGFEVGAELSRLGKSVGQVVDSARGRASGLKSPSAQSSGVDVSLSGYARRPGSRVASAFAGWR